MTSGEQRRLTVIVPGALETRTGGYGYDRRMITGLRAHGWSVDVEQLDGSFPFPTASARAQAARALAALPDGATVLVDGLAFGALPVEIGRERARLDIVALVHHPLAAETGLSAAAAAALEESERRALACARAVVVTSRATAAALAGYGVSGGRITVIEPGTDPAPLAHTICNLQSPICNLQSAICNLLCVATLTPRKGHALLFRALALLRDRPWRLVCAGGLERDPATVDRLRAQLRADRIADRVELAGDLDADALAVEYDRADLFVLPTLHEGYGMSVAEALARGLPVVSSATGGIPDLVGDEAGIVVATGDLEGFTAALARLLDDVALRNRLAEGAQRMRGRLPTWDTAVTALAGVLRAASGPSDPELRQRAPTPLFSADWLALREPADAAARSSRLTGAIAHALSPDAALRVLDLGAGTGANLRYLSPRLPQPQRWLLVDRDAALLGRVDVQDHGTCRVAVQERDLATMDAASTADLFSGRTLVTASALLDLVSADWVRALLARCREARAAVLFALSYDGRIVCTPADPDDAMVCALVNAHQRTDKGFGPALGPDATAVAATSLVEHGYRVERDRSDWLLAPGSEALQRQLIEGWAEAATAVAPQRAEAIDAWRSRRLSHVAAGRSHIIVGHEDIAGTCSAGLSGPRCGGPERAALRF